VTSWLLDTNVLSELRRPRPTPGVVRFIAAQPLDQLYLSVVAFAEIRFGIEHVVEPARRAELTEWLTLKLRPMFNGRVLPVSEDVMLRWRLLVDEGRQAGHTFTQPDLIVAATALQYGMTLVTRDTRDFLRTGVPALNPWTDAAAC
jgi:toxin FitB